MNTYETGAGILEWFRENKLILPLSRIGIVDCITRMIGVEADDDDNIKIANHPVDLTGIGIRISQFLEEYSMRKNVRKIQLCVNSLSALLLYSNIRIVYKFLHVYTRRIKAAGGLGIYVLESGIHDMQSIATLNHLFDGVMEIKSENGKNFIRVIGLSPKPTLWLEYEIDGAKVMIT